MPQRQLTNLSWNQDLGWPDLESNGLSLSSHPLVTGNIFISQNDAEKDYKLTTILSFIQTYFQWKDLRTFKKSVIIFLCTGKGPQVNERPKWIFCNMTILFGKTTSPASFFLTRIENFFYVLFPYPSSKIKNSQARELRGEREKK